MTGGEKAGQGESWKWQGNEEMIKGELIRMGIQKYLTVENVWPRAFPRDTVERPSGENAKQPWGVGGKKRGHKGKKRECVNPSASTCHCLEF